MDDSNNEPSITVGCGGNKNGTWWRVQRMVTLGSNYLREDLCVENLSDAEASFAVVEGTYGTLVARGVLPMADSLAPITRSLHPRKLKEAIPVTGDTVTISPRGVWSTTQYWVPHDAS
mmetsp:Transcript_156716/g.272720  ORF Transcript_156716/g.272720 Transcript_156716/m.272720 type:complete len:118 (+) Transcript_156716:3-356(+)